LSRAFSACGFWRPLTQGCDDSCLIAATLGWSVQGRWPCRHKGSINGKRELIITPSGSEHITKAKNREKTVEWMVILLVCFFSPAHQETLLFDLESRLRRELFSTGL
jgi:hypothetical protein